MIESNTSICGLDPFYDRGFSGEVNWFSETKDAGVAPAVLARSGLLSRFDEFMNGYVGSRFDAVEGGLAWGQSDADGLEGSLSATVFLLFIPIQEATTSDYQSIYEFGRESIINLDTMTLLNSKQQTEHSHSLIAAGTGTAAEEYTVLFHVTPLGAIWIIAESSQAGPDVETLLKISQQEIAATHQEHIQDNKPLTSDSGERGKRSSDPILPEGRSIPPEPIHQLIAASEEYND